MQRIVVADIFGYTPALEALVDRLPGDIDIIDPYEGHHLSFVSEADAYDFFISEGGLDRYTELLSSRIEKFKSPVSLLGFSVGASAIWRLSNQGISQRISGAAGFYSSQIRHYTNIDPSFPICLLFPKDERHFSVTELIEVVGKKQNVAVLQSDSLHGFMNLDSPNYDHSAYLYYLKALSRLPSNRCFRSLKDVVDSLSLESRL